MIYVKAINFQCDFSVWVEVRAEEIEEKQWWKNIMKLPIQHRLLHVCLQSTLLLRIRSSGGCRLKVESGCDRRSETGQSVDCLPLSAALRAAAFTRKLNGLCLSTIFTLSFTVSRRSHRSLVILNADQNMQSKKNTKYTTLIKHLLISVSAYVAFTLQSSEFPVRLSSVSFPWLYSVKA